MRKWGILTTLVCALAAGSPDTLARAADLSIKAGVGYEFLSQQYFLDSALLEGPDSTLTEWSLSSTYLDDIKGQVTFLYQAEATEISGTIEQTADFLRLRGLTSYSHHSGRSRIDLDGEFEWRNRFGRADDFGDSYLFYHGRIRAATPIAADLYGVSQVRIETVDFFGAEEFSFDYARISGKIGVEKSFEDFSFIEAGIIAGTRQVPDSLVMNYTTCGIDGSVFAFLPTGDIDLTARMEYRDYNRPDAQDDHTRLETFGRNRFTLSDSWFTRQEIDFEALLYSQDDLVNADFARVGAALLAGKEIGGLTVAAGPDVEWLTEAGRSELDSLMLTGEDYFEYGLKLNLDYLGSSGFFGSLQSVTGYRDLQAENEFQTNFRFQRLFAMADIRIYSVLNLTMMFSAEWEWHDLDQNDSELYLLSSTLNYAF